MEIEVNAQFEQVLRFVNETNQLIFLTGRAGTGKTTLLKYIRDNTFKQISVVAPTGVAAINAGGSTIHSFFQFPFTPFLPVINSDGEPGSHQANLPVLKYNSQRLGIFRNLELLVIDEISMVRADLLDQIDVTLRQTRRKWHLPFGGVQVMLIGDMYQLPPVVQQEEWHLLKSHYSSPFFFDSHVVRKNPPVYIELEKIYRQNESQFIDLLNKVRNNKLDAAGLDLLNSHYKPVITPEDERDHITLTTHNKKADEINARNLAGLEGKAYTFTSRVEGTFSERSYPADEKLVLKKGTRVMFLKNNSEKNYYNGKIGVVTYIDGEKIKVKCGEDPAEIEVGRESWTNVSYNLDKATKHIEEEVLGTFEQYPLRLAWAITIHKSQGLTFDRLIIDAAEAFSAGQVYVALSRCRSLAGLTLSSRIGPQSLTNDNNILNFAATKQDAEKVDTIFSSAQRMYLRTVLLDLFDLSEVARDRGDLAGSMQMHRLKINPEGMEWSRGFFEKVDALYGVSGKFINQLSALIGQAADPEKDPALQERIKKAAAYFGDELGKCLHDLKNCALVTESKEAATDLNETLQSLFEVLFSKQALIRHCAAGFVLGDFIKAKLKMVYPPFRMNVYASAKNAKVSADVKHPALYRELMLVRDEICNDEQKPIYLVANNKSLAELANYLPSEPDHLLRISGFGKAKAEAYGDQFLRVIKDYMREHGLESNMNAKSAKATGKKTSSKKEKKENGGEADDATAEKVSTKEQTYKLFRKGLSVEDIARERKITVGTVEQHLVPYVASGELNIDYLVSRQKQSLIAAALEGFKYADGLASVKSTIPEDVSYSEIRYVMARQLNEHM